MRVQPMKSLGGMTYGCDASMMGTPRTAPSCQAVPGYTLLWEILRSMVWCVMVNTCAPVCVRFLPQSTFHKV